MSKFTLSSATPRKVLVTGSDGYIGSALVDRLTISGYHVVGLDTFYFHDCLFGSQPTPIDSINADIRHLQLTDLEGIDAIIHLAALSNDPLGEIEESLTRQINHAATIHLAKLAKQAGVSRFLYASSCSIYGKSDLDWMSEESPVAPLTAYAKSKVSAESDLRKLADATFVPIILRCATVFGVTGKLRVDLVANNLAAWAATTGEIKIMSDGTPWRPLIHVEDLVTVYQFFLQAPLTAIQDGVFNVGFNSHNYQVKDIAEQVAQAMPGTRVVYAGQPEKDSRSYKVDFSKLQRLSGLKPQYDLKRGIEQIIQAYRTHNLSQEDFLGRKFVRLKQIQHLLATGQIDSSLEWTSQTPALMPGCIEKFGGGGNPRQTDLKDLAGNAEVSLKQMTL